ncbi:hypothetical protein NHX12_002163, partial [Muraenolepis orangiensis]
MHGTTTGKEIFEEVSKCVTEIKLPWDKLVGLMTDGAPAMCGKKSGLVGMVREKMREENCAGKDTAELREQKFLCELAFLCDISSHLDALNLQLQGRGRIITDMYAA